MRVTIPLIAVMTLASSAAIAGPPLSYNQQAYAVSQLALNLPSMAPTPDVFGDSPDRIRVAEQAARLINSGDCKGARKLVARRADQRMAARVEDACAMPKTE
uniref:UrcA family protein n=1 Tax=Caulobacter sp. (strain K31) TaxID=366602 RepID=B0T8V0_CAUSK